jgi:hypothetical protein
MSWNLLKSTEGVRPLCKCGIYSYLKTFWCVPHSGFGVPASWHGHIWWQHLWTIICKSLQEVTQGHFQWFLSHFLVSHRQPYRVLQYDFAVFVFEKVCVVMFVVTGDILPSDAFWLQIIFVLSQSSIVTGNCQLFKNLENSVNSLLNTGDKIMEFLASIVIHGAEKLAWTIWILLECLQHILKMYAWSWSENQASIWFKCRLIGLMLKQSFFRKHDFAAVKL